MNPNPQIKMRSSRVCHPRPQRPATREKTRRPATILVPTDFSYSADRALHYAMNLARRRRAPVALLHVVAPAAIASVFLPSVRTDLPQLAERSREHLARLARRMGVRPKHATVRTGHAAAEILRHADELGAELIVIGARGHGKLSRVLIGTTAERVVRHARCPVLVVPLPKVAGAARPVVPPRRD